MATLTSGNTASVTLTAGQILIISSATYSKIEILENGTNSRTPRTLDTEVVHFGPFTKDKSLTLSCTIGSVEHNVQTITQVSSPMIIVDSIIDNDGRADGTCVYVVAP